MPVYTNFRFPTLPIRSILKINGTVANIGVWYNEGDNVTVEKSDSNHYGEPYDSFTYQTTNGVLTSEILSIIINVPPDKTTPLLSSDLDKNIINNSSISVSDIIPINNSVDRIKLLSYSNTGELLLNGANIFPNLVIMRYDLENFIFTSSQEGLGSPYHIITYLIGNIDGFDSNIYSINFNIEGLTSLLTLIENDGISTDPNGIDPNVYYKEATIKIADGFVGSIVKLSFQSILSSSAFPASTNNKITIDYEDGNQIIQDSTLIYIDVPVNENGYAIINLVAGFIEADLPIIGYLEFIIIDVDGDPLKVSPNNNVSLNLDFQN